MRPYLVLIFMSLLYSQLHSQEIKTKKKAGKIGFYVGKEQIIEPKYDRVDHKIEGFYEVWIKDKVGIVAENGQEIIPCEYESISGFPQNGYIVKKDGFYGAFNSDGDMALDIRYDAIQYYSDSLSLVEEPTKYYDKI